MGELLSWVMPQFPLCLWGSRGRPPLRSVEEESEESLKVGGNSPLLSLAWVSSDVPANFFPSVCGINFAMCTEACAPPGETHAA